MNLSNTILNVRLPSGNHAVYEVQPQHMNLPDLAQAAIEHGRQIAHQHGDRWYHAGGWTEITDLRTIALLERATSAEGPWKDGELAYCRKLVADGGNSNVPGFAIDSYLLTQLVDARKDARQDVIAELEALRKRWAKK